MSIWQDAELAARLDGQTIDVEGWVYPLAGPGAASYFALVAEAPCCLGCLPRDPTSVSKCSPPRPSPPRAAPCGFGGAGGA